MKRRQEMEIENTYRTPDLSEASFLYASGQKLLGLEDDHSRFWFVFEDKSTCERLTNLFWQKEATVNAKELCDSIRTLKDLIFNRERRGNRNEDKRKP